MFPGTWCRCLQTAVLGLIATGAPGTADSSQPGTGDTLATYSGTPPRMIWQTGDEERIRARIGGDPVALDFHEYLIGQADGMPGLPPLERIVTGRRLLSVSRDALKRSTHLAYAWRMTRERRYLDALDRVLLDVCGFADWNPGHFLDVAEMSLAVALALDWAGDELPGGTVRAARAALLEKALLPGFEAENRHVFERENNWNQVCNCGIVAAALVLADEHPQPAAQAIERMRANLGKVIATYAPDGVYPEGPAYWEYGTTFNAVLLSMLESALGTDYCLGSAPGFMETAGFMQQMITPRGDFFNFSDCDPDVAFVEGLCWFAMKSGQYRYLQADAIRKMRQRPGRPADGQQRLAPVAFLWYVHCQPTGPGDPPLAWMGRGMNPVGVFRSAYDDPAALYLGFKGGRADISHPNMDAGSFILELDGVRWAIDLAKGSYHQQETWFARHGGALFDRRQNSARWTLLNKNNFGHNTLTVDEQLHRVDGYAAITGFDPVARTAVVDLSGPLAGQVRSATRQFMVPDDRTVHITDRIEVLENTGSVRWQMLTTAEVEIIGAGAILRQDGRTLSLHAQIPQSVQLSVTPLNPPPLEVDEWVRGLKRIDITVPASLAVDGCITIRVSLTGDPQSPGAGTVKPIDHRTPDP